MQQDFASRSQPDLPAGPREQISPKLPLEIAEYEPNRTDYATVLRTRIQGDNPPDVAILPGIGTLRSLARDGSLISIAENLVGVQKHYIEASGKLWDPTVPDDGASAGDGIGHSEFAGPTFSPDGQWLFVNIQVPGITCAITGPWGDLGL